MNNLKLSDFKELHPIATTLTSQIISARTKDNPANLYVLKKIEKEILKKNNLVQAYQQNIQNLSMINNSHFLQLLNHFEDKKNVYLLFENQKFFTMHSIIHNITEQTTLKIFRQILNALLYLHRSHITHYNIKLKSILLTEDYKVKLGDFGWALPAKIEKQKKKSICDCIEQWAPEILLKQPLSEKYDVWCLGIVLYYTLLGRSPFHAILAQYKGKKLMEKLSQDILKGQIDFSQLPDGAKELLQQMLIREQSARISVQNILKHWWVNGYKEKPQPLLVQPEDRDIRKRSLIDMKPLPKEEEIDFLNTQQEERWKRRSQMNFSQIQAIPRFVEKLEKGLSADNAATQEDDSSDDGNDKQLRRQTKIIDEVEEENLKEEEINEEIKVEEKKVENERKNSEEIIPQRKSLANKIQEKKSNQQQQQEAPSQIRGRAKTRFQVLTEQKKESNALFKLNAENLQAKADQLKMERDDLQNEKVMLEVQLKAQVPESSLNQIKEKYLASDSSYYKLMRQSTVTYYNYDSTTKQQYVQLLLSKIPQLKTEKFCLKQQKQDQFQQIETFPIMQENIKKLEEELENLQKQKQQYRQIMQIMEGQKNEIVEKKNIMWIEVGQIYIDDQISSKLNQYSKSQSDYSHLATFIQELDQMIKQSKLEQPEEQSPSFILTPLLEQQSSLRHSTTFIEEENKWKQKLEQLEMNYQKQKQQQEIRKEQLLEENKKLKEKACQKEQIENYLMELTQKRNELSGLNSRVLEYENELKLEIRIIEDKLQWLKQYEM